MLSSLRLIHASNSCFATLLNASLALCIVQMLADESMGDDSPTLASLRALNEGWRNVSDKAKQRQRQLEAALKEASAFQNEVGIHSYVIYVYKFYIYINV